MPEARETEGSKAEIDINLRTMPDGILQDLIAEITGTSAEIEITLMVGGILCSGLLVSNHLYLEHFQSHFAKVCNDKNVVSSVQAKCKEGREATKSLKSAEKPSPAPSYICLKDARFFPPGKDKKSTKSVWWRGRLSEIDGFSLGRMDEGRPLLDKNLREQMQVEDM